MNKYLGLFLIIFSCFISKAQVNRSIDSIDFYKFYSPTIFLHVPTVKLLLFMDKPNSFLLKRDLPCPHNDNEIFSFHSLWYKKESLIYWDYKDTSHLHAIKIKKSDYKIYYEDFCFYKNTQLQDVVKYFQIPTTRIDTICGGIVPFKANRRSAYYQIVFTYPAECKDEIVLYFDNKEYLVDIRFYIYR